MSAFQAFDSNPGNSLETQTQPQTETLEFTLESQQSHQAHQKLMLEMEAKKRAFGLDVPTLPQDVHTALRNLQEPILLFGENPANVRDRLRMCMARQLVLLEYQQKGGQGEEMLQDFITQQGSTFMESSKQPKNPIEGTKYTHANSALIQAREYIAQYSLPRSKQRLYQERKRRKGTFFLHEQTKNQLTNTRNIEEEEEEELMEVQTLNQNCWKLHHYTKHNMGLECSQYGGDSRPLSALSCSRNPFASNDPQNKYWVATGGWSGAINIWDPHSNLDCVSQKRMAHEDRIMGIAFSPQSSTMSDGTHDVTEKTMLATASIDLTAKLWTVQINPDHVPLQEDDYDMIHPKSQQQLQQHQQHQQHKYQITQEAHLKGHAARLCKVSWHTSGRYVGTTSFDHTWRLWDVETSSESILLQDGHFRECYGISLNHVDGSLAATTDFAGVVQLWDLRTGKSIASFQGHAKRVLCCEFSPVGFHLATAGDDGMLKIWDLRKRPKPSNRNNNKYARNTSTGKKNPQGQYASIPAHSNLITQLRYDTNNGESLVSSSFDGTAKVWSTRNYKLLTTLRGHEGKVMASDFVYGGKGVVTVGYDKTLKLWS